MAFGELALDVGNGRSHSGCNQCVRRLDKDRRSLWRSVDEPIKVHAMPKCVRWDDIGWVCEDHPDKPWDGASDREDACHCGGAGLPCSMCNRTVGQQLPEMPPGYRTMIDTDGPKH